MKTKTLFFFIPFLCVALCLTDALVFGSDWVQPSPQSGSDYAGQLLLKHESELVDIYAPSIGKLNILKSSFAGVGAPLSPNTGQVWYDTANHRMSVRDTLWGNGGWYAPGGDGVFSTITTTNILSTGTNTFSGLQSVSGGISSSGSNTWAGTQNFSGSSSFTGNISSNGTTTWTGQQTFSGLSIFSNLSATGTATFSTVNIQSSSSTTLVTNLNANFVGGYSASTTTGSQVIPVSDSGGRIPWGTKPAFRGVLAYGTANQVISTGTTTAIKWDAEAYDTDSIHSTSTSTNTIFTIPSGVSRVRFSAGVYFGTSTTGTGYMTCYLTGSAITTMPPIYTGPTNSLAVSTISVTGPAIAVSPGDTFYIACYQNSGGDMTFYASGNLSTLRSYAAMEILE